MSVDGWCSVCMKKSCCWAENEPAVIKSADELPPPALSHPTHLLRNLQKDSFITFMTRSEFSSSCSCSSSSLWWFMSLNVLSMKTCQMCLMCLSVNTFWWQQPSSSPSSPSPFSSSSSCHANLISGSSAQLLLCSHVKSHQLFASASFWKPYKHFGAPGLSHGFQNFTKNH